MSAPDQRHKKKRLAGTNLFFLCLPQIFLQTEALGHDFLGGFHPDIAVVPGLIPYAGQALLVPWVAEDKAIFLAVGLSLIHI